MESGDSALDTYCQKFQEKEHKNEEFEAFEKRVDEISKLIADFSSVDKNISTAAMRRAQQLLSSGSTDEDDEDRLSRGKSDMGSGGGDTMMEADNKEVDETKLRVKQNKTVINQKAFDKFYESDQSGSTMSQDAFMKSVEVDAQKRADARKERQQMAEKHKKNGNKAFKSGNYEAALVQYDKALEQVKDSPLLYTNRALTLLRLNLHEQVLPDCEKALQLDQHNLKAHLYKARALYCLGGHDKALLYIEQLMDTYPQYHRLIDSYKHSIGQEEG